MLALPGSVYLYQGEELGLHEVADIPAERIQDPAFLRSGGAEKLSLLADGFTFGDRRVPLVGPQGIFKPAILP